MVNAILGNLMGMHPSSDDNNDDKTNTPVRSDTPVRTDNAAKEIIGTETGSSSTENWEASNVFTIFSLGMTD